MRVEWGKVGVRREGTDKGRMPGGEGEEVGAIVEAEVRGGVVVGLVEGLAADLVGTGVTAVAVSPGATRTPMLERTAALYGVENIEDFRQSNHLRRILEPEELAKTVAFCCSPEAGILNGSVVVATGGL